MCGYVFCMTYEVKLKRDLNIQQIIQQTTTTWQDYNTRK
jgi:adenine C2-methylase RlmN of 23S rRNA A2503 and tRNA A37